MSTLLLRLAAPMQSWGVDSKFDIRRTSREPTKSGVVGLLAAALGRSREQPVDDLAALRFGVRTDQQGELLRDFHMAAGEKSYVTTRYYLADAVFLVGLESDDDALLHALDDAVRNPCFPLFLGRRSCPPEGRVSLGIRELPLQEALENEPWLACEWRRGFMDGRLVVTVDAERSTGAARMRDVPISFSQLHRQFGFRQASRSMTRDMNAGSAGAAEPTVYPEHDPMEELEGKRCI